jgi:urease accessory protein UreF
LLGEVHPLLHQLGSPDGVAGWSDLARALRVPRVDSLARLRDFLEAYRRQVLVPHEWPVICRACSHACRHEVRELVRLDQETARRGWPEELAAASRRTGRAQLLKLRPLRDHRVIQRYLAAVEAGAAHAWHPVVYGLTLGVYSIPPRQGLVRYAELTLNGFLDAAARSLRISEAEARSLWVQLTASLPGELEGVLNACNEGSGTRARS